MDMLVDISSRSCANEHFVEQLRADKVPEEARRIKTPSVCRAVPAPPPPFHTHTSRGHTHRKQMSAEAWQAVPEAMVDISDAVRAKVVIRMRCTPVLNLVTSDKDSGSEKEAVSIHKK